MHAAARGRRRRSSCVDGGPHRAGRPPDGADLDRARSRRSTEAAARRAHASPRPTCRVARSTPEEFRRLALAHRVGAPARDAPGRARSMSAHHRDRAEPRAAGVARHDGRRARARAEQPGRGRAARGRAAGRRARRARLDDRRVRRVGHRARARRGELVELQRAGAARRRAARTALDALDAADAEDELLDALEELGVAEPWRLAEPLAAAGVDATWLDAWPALAGPATARGARAGSPPR